jgi:hypothetical protein
MTNEKKSRQARKFGSIGQRAWDMSFKTRGQKSEVRGQMAEDRRHRTAGSRKTEVGGSRADDRYRIGYWGLRISASRQLPSASLGHYASLSSFARGMSRRSDDMNF